MAAATIRAARPGDVPAIRRVARTAWHAAHADIVGADTVDAFLDEYYAPGRLLEQVGQDGRAFYVAVGDGGTLVGFATAGPTEAPEADWSLYAIYVLPDRWGEGVGSALLSRAEEWVRDRGGRRLRLVVMQDNGRAVAFYEHRGYERVADHWDETLGAAGWVYVANL